MTADRLRRVLLVGFMGAGKSSVGRRVAVGLGWRFIDFDEAIEREAGLSVAELFAKWGEAGFRSLESRVANRLLLEEHVVLGSGGGWGAVPGRLEELPEGTETIWLRVSAEAALTRVRGQPGTRPLLERKDPLVEAVSLLGERVPYYRRAGRAVDTEGRTVEDVAARILEILVSEYPELRVNER